MRFVDIEFDRDIVGINSRAAKDEGFLGSHTDVLDAIDRHGTQGTNVGCRHAHKASETRVAGNGQRDGAGCFAFSSQGLLRGLGGCIGVILSRLGYRILSHIRAIGGLVLAN